MALRFVFVLWLFISWLFFHSIWTCTRRICWLFLFSGTCIRHLFISSNFVLRLYLFLEAIEILMLTSSSFSYVSLTIFRWLGLCLIRGPSMLKTSSSSLATSASSAPSTKDWRWLIISPRGGWLIPFRVHWSQSYILIQIKFSYYEI